MRASALTHHYSDDLEGRLDVIFHALANRTRRALLARLAAGPERVTELAQPFDMSLPSVSKHLRVLERAGLLARAIDGRVHRCELNAEALQQVTKWLDHYRVFWGDTLDALAKFVESDDRDEDDQNEAESK